MADTVPHYWLECAVSLPDTDKPGEMFTCQAKVECCDVVDALDLDRWSAQAFQHLWKSAGRTGDHRIRELAHARWYLERALGSGWQTTMADTVASMIERVLETHGEAGTDLPDALKGLAANLRGGDARAFEVLAESYIAEMRSRER